MLPLPDNSDQDPVPVVGLVALSVADDAQSV
jgi:hypothetical protein